MRIEALALIENDDVAQRLIATFELVAERFGPADREDDTFVERWAAVSGTDEDDVRRLWDLLFENGLLYIVGTADERALDLIRARVRGNAKKLGVTFEDVDA